MSAFFLDIRYSNVENGCAASGAIQTNDRRLRTAFAEMRLTKVKHGIVVKTHNSYKTG